MYLFISKNRTSHNLQDAIVIPTVLGLKMNLL